jgi:hypothetical protein
MWLGLHAVEVEQLVSLVCGLHAVDVKQLVPLACDLHAGRLVHAKRERGHDSGLR